MKPLIQIHYEVGSNRRRFNACSLGKRTLYCCTTSEVGARPYGFDQGQTESISTNREYSADKRRWRNNDAPLCVWKYLILVHVYRWCC
jgi:hypothetical protein